MFMLSKCNDDAMEWYYTCCMNVYEMLCKCYINGNEKWMYDNEWCKWKVNACKVMMTCLYEMLCQCYVKV